MSRGRLHRTPSKRATSSRGLGVTTLKDVARVAGVSAQTVSCVINNSGSVSDGVRQQIREIADQLGYRPNRSAKAMRTGRSQTIGLIVSDIRHPFYPELAHAVESAAADAGYAVLLVDAHGSPEEAAERITTLKSHAVDGVISTVNTEAVSQLGLPTVIMGDPMRGVDSITSDDVQGGTLLADYILANGHRRIGLVTSPLPGCIPLRRGAFLERMGRRASIAWEVYTPVSGIITDEVRAALNVGGPTAIVCSDDLIAVGVLRTLRQQGRDVPGDLSVVGYDDIPWASIVSPGLSTVRQPFWGMGKGAVDLILGRIANPSRRSRRIKLEVELVPRDTVGAIESAAPRRSRLRGFAPSEAGRKVAAAE